MNKGLRTCRVTRLLLFSGLALGMLAFAAAPATAQSEELSPVKVGDLPFVPVLGNAKDEALRAMLGEKSGVQTFSPADHECPGGTPHVTGSSCGGTNSGTLTTADCVFTDGSYYDVYGFAGTAGQQVTITLTSTAFDAFLLLYNPSGGQPVAFNDDGGGGTNSQIVFTLNVTGTWFIAANSFDANQFGAYTLTIQCGSGPPPGGCTPNSTTLCLNSGRFRVTGTFATTAGQSGPAMAVTETTDTGMFWFFSANNIEVIIKVVSACTFPGAPRYWVFAAGLTNVQVVITVTDTSNGTVRTYTNPQGTAFAPVQDTNAFATCP